MEQGASVFRHVFHNWFISGISCFRTLYIYLCVWQTEFLSTSPSSGMIYNLPGCLFPFLRNTKCQEINSSVAQPQSQGAVLWLEEQKDEKEEAYFLLYSGQLFPVVFCNSVFLDFETQSKGE